MNFIGKKGKIEGFNNEQLSARLLELGFMPGKTMEVVRKAPLGQTYMVKIGHHSFVLRKEEIEAIAIDKWEDR